MNKDGTGTNNLDSILTITGGALALLGGLLFVAFKYIPVSLVNVLKPFNYFFVNYQLLGIIGSIVGIVIIVMGILMFRYPDKGVSIGIAVIILALATIVTSAFGIIVGGVLVLIGGMVAVSSSHVTVHEVKLKPVSATEVEAVQAKPSVENVGEKKPIVAARPVDYSGSQESSPFVKPKAGEELVPIIVEPRNADRLRVLERTLIDIEKCPDGGEWIPPYRRKDGKLIKGHCRKIKQLENISKTSVKKEYRHLLKEQEAGPKVVGYEKKSPDKDENAVK